MRSQPDRERITSAGGSIDLESGVSLFTGEPFCVVRMGAERAQLDPEHMRQLGRQCFEVAEAAVADAALFALHQSWGLAAEDAGRMIYALRQFRLDMRGGDEPEGT